MKKKWALLIVLVVLSKFTLLAALPVPPELKKIVVFIFAPTETGIRPMGTGFFVGVQTSEQPERFGVYLVTARHVLQESVNERAEGAETRFYPLVFVRLTKKGGGTKLLPLPLVTRGTQKNIFVHDDPTVDLAVVPMLPDQEEYDFKFLPDEFLTTKDSFAELKIREGHEVFFTGLFLPHLGSKANYPVVRFGRVALVTDERIRWKGVDTELYLIESWSYGGNSGSPTFFHMGAEREPGSLIVGSPVLKLAGVIKGSFYEGRPIQVVETTRNPVSVSNIGITAVIPAFKLHEILFGKELMKQRASGGQ